MTAKGRCLARFDFDVLEQYVHATFGPDPEADFQSTGSERLVTDGFIANLTGKSRGLVWRWRHEGGIPIWAADEACIAIGIDAVELWPDFYTRPLWHTDLASAQRATDEQELALCS